MSFNLPQDYKVPSSGSSFMKLEDGANKFRILADPLLGWSYWTTENGKQKIYRVPMEEKNKIPENADPLQVRHFWALVVWNYQAKAIQVLEITQKKIQRQITALVSDPDWADATGYDITITKTGQKQNSEYTVIASLPKKLTEEITDKIALTTVNLAALFYGENPFKASSGATFITSNDLEQKAPKKEKVEEVPAGQEAFDLPKIMDDMNKEEKKTPVKDGDTVSDEDLPF